MQYNNSEFKELLIDSNVNTRSRGNIGQLKALQKFFSVELNKKIASLTNFVFIIRNILFIDIVNLNIY